MSENYTDILQSSWDSIPKPKLLPVGCWVLRGRNVAVFPPQEEGKATRVAFFYEAREPLDDVSQTDLSGLGDDYSYAENDIVKQFFINRNKDWDTVRRHLELHGVTTEGRTIQESFKEFRNKDVISYLGTRTYKDASGELKEDNDPTNFAAMTA